MLLEEVKQIIKMLGQVLLVVSHLHQVQVVAQVVVLAVHQVHHHLHNQLVEDRKVVLIATFFFCPFMLQ